MVARLCLAARAEAEAEIFGKLREIAADATAVLIAHRFSTVRMADEILVLEQGALIERGSHGEAHEAERDVRAGLCRVRHHDS